MKNTLKLIFILCDCVAGMNVCALRMESRRGCHIPSNSSSWWLVISHPV